MARARMAFLGDEDYGAEMDAERFQGPDFKEMVQDKLWSHRVDSSLLIPASKYREGGRRSTSEVDD